MRLAFPHGAAGRAALITALVLMPAAASAHGVQTDIERASAVSVRFTLGGEGALADARYRVLAPGSDAPFQRGRSDATGRVVFRPDRAGPWRVHLSTANGHGGRRVIRVADPSTAADQVAQAPSGASWLLRLGAGAGYLIGLAGVFVLWRQRRGAG